MFGHQPYYFSTIRKMTIYFGTVFNNITITRNNSSSDETHLLRVPLQYGPKNKHIARVNDDPDIQKEAAIVLPRMSFEMTSLMYDSNRKLTSSGKLVKELSTDANKFRRMYNPVPYNFTFSLFIYAKHIEDGAKIIEQILPFFTPDYTATVNMIPEMDIEMDIPIILNGIRNEDSYEGQFEDRRVYIWTLDFTMKGAFWGPIVNKPVIKISNTQFFIGNTLTTNTMVGSISVTPGLDANGDGTSNGSVTIPYSEIFVDDSWEYIITESEPSTVFLANS